MNTKKRILFIGIGGIVVIVLVVAILLIQLLPKREIITGAENDPNVNTEYDRELDNIYLIKERQIKSVTVENEKDTFTLYKKENGQIVIEGYENVPLMDESISALFKSVQKVVSENRIETGCKDFAPYGLDKPSAKITVTSTRDTKDVLLLGDKTADGKAYYFCLDGRDTVFCVNQYFGERVLKSHSDFYEMTLSKVYTEANFLNLSIDYNDPQKNIFIRMCTDKEIDQHLYADSMVMTSPITFGVDSSVVRKETAALKELEALEVVCEKPTKDDMIKYGFTSSSPVVKVGFNVDLSVQTVDGVANPYYSPDAKEGEKAELSSMYMVGGTEGNTVYIMYDSASVIYAVPAETFAFVNTEINHFCQLNVFIRYLSELKGFEVFKGNDSYKIETHTKTDKEGKVSYFGTYRGTELKSDYVQNLYKEIVSIMSIGVAEDPKTKTEYKIVLYGIDGINTTVEFSPIDGLYSFCKVNGEGMFYVSSTILDRIWEDTKTLCSGGEVNFEY